MASDLSQYSSAEDVEAALRDNADFLEAGSVAKAKAFCTAYVHWLTWTAKVGQSGGGAAGERLEVQAEQFQQVYQAAQGFITANDSPSNDGTGVTHVDFRDFER